ncbi:hypothetical protein [Kitasatospora sp. NPDC002040]|uniref:hypothetical protein n=1 Tax=Kitasatospora sp. NPDC002040 TaxID=3154661 RepID=UPI00331B41CD
MPLIRPALRLATALLAGLALTGPALPAAADKGPVVYDGPLAVSLLPWDPTPVRGAFLGDVGPYEAVRTRFDARDLAGVANMSATPDCTPDGTAYVCRHWHVEGLPVWGSLQLMRAEGAEAGASGVLHITLTNATGTLAEVDVTIVIGGPNLEFGPLPTPADQPLGEVVSPSLQITNTGTLPAERVILTLTPEKGATIAEQFGNCRYAKTSAVVCVVDSPIAPGETVTLDPVPITFELPTSSVEFAAQANWDSRPASSERQLEQLGYETGSGPHLTFGRPETPVTALGPVGLHDSWRSYRSRVSLAPAPTANPSVGSPAGSPDVQASGSSITTADASGRPGSAVATAVVAAAALVAATAGLALRRRARRPAD